MLDIPRPISLEADGRADILRRTAMPVDDMETARKRMRHLAPWRVAPVPMRSHTAAAPPTKPCAANAERCRRLAFQVLAVQMAQTPAKSALR